MSDSSAGGNRYDDEPSRKRSREEASAEGAASATAAATSSSPTSLDFAKMSRSERKRHREKKRRSDVNKGFDELMSLLLEIDPGVRAEAEEKAIKGQWKGVGRDGSTEDNMLSRVELISKTVEVLRRVHTENEERKQIISTLMRRSSGSGMNLPPTPAQRMGGSIPSEFSSLMQQHQDPGLVMAAAAATGTPYLGSVLLEQVRAQQFQQQLLGAAGSNAGTDVFGLRSAAAGGAGTSAARGLTRSDLIASGDGSSSLGGQQQQPPQQQQHGSSRLPTGGLSSLPMDSTARRLLHSGQITAQQYLEILQNRETSQDGKSPSDDSGSMSLRGIRPPPDP